MSVNFSTQHHQEIERLRGELEAARKERDAQKRAGMAEYHRAQAAEAMVDHYRSGVREQVEWFQDRAEHFESRWKNPRLGTEMRATERGAQVVASAARDQLNALLSSEPDLPEEQGDCERCGGREEIERPAPHYGTEEVDWIPCPDCTGKEVGVGADGGPQSEGETFPSTERTEPVAPTSVDSNPREFSREAIAAGAALIRVEDESAFQFLGRQVRAVVSAQASVDSNLDQGGVGLPDGTDQAAARAGGRVSSSDLPERPRESGTERGLGAGADPGSARGGTQSDVAEAAVDVGGGPENLNCCECGKPVGKDGSVTVETFEMSNEVSGCDALCGACLRADQQKCPERYGLRVYQTCGGECDVSPSDVCPNCDGTGLEPAASQQGDACFGDGRTCSRGRCSTRPSPQGVIEEMERLADRREDSLRLANGGELEPETAPGLREAAQLLRKHLSDSGGQR